MSLNIDAPRNRPLIPVNRTAAALLLLSALVGCGGGGGDPAPTGHQTPTTLNSGIYVDTANDLALALLPTQSGSRSWYGLRVLAGNPLPVSYQGGLDASSLTGVSRSLVASSPVNTGTAALTAVTAASLTGLVTIANTDSPARALAAQQVTALTAAELASTWSGTWSVKGASATNEAVALGLPLAAGNVVISGFLNCAVTVTSLAGQSGADGVYNVTLTFSGGSCPISGARSGVLMAYAAGGFKQLRLVAFNTGLTESVSFRAQLP